VGEEEAAISGGEEHTTTKNRRILSATMTFEKYSKSLKVGIAGEKTHKKYSLCIQ
jgi:hypothetical protein